MRKVWREMSSNVLFVFFSNAAMHATIAQCRAGIKLITRGTNFYQRTSSPQEVKQVAQHACRRAPDKESLVGHGIEGTAPGRQFHGQALMMRAIHQEGQWHLEYFRHFGWVGAQAERW